MHEIGIAGNREKCGIHDYDKRAVATDAAAAAMALAVYNNFEREIGKRETHTTCDWIRSMRPHKYVHCTSQIHDLSALNALPKNVQNKMKFSASDAARLRVWFYPICCHRSVGWLVGVHNKGSLSLYGRYTVHACENSRNKSFIFGIRSLGKYFVKMLPTNSIGHFEESVH